MGLPSSPVVCFRLSLCISLALMDGGWEIFSALPGMLSTGTTTGMVTQHPHRGLSQSEDSHFPLGAVERSRTWGAERRCRLAKPPGASSARPAWGDVEAGQGGGALASAQHQRPATDRQTDTSLHLGTRSLRPLLPTKSVIVSPIS